MKMANDIQLMILVWKAKSPYLQALYKISRIMASSKIKVAIIGVALW